MSLCVKIKSDFLQYLFSFKFIFLTLPFHLDEELSLLIIFLIP